MGDHEIQPALDGKFAELNKAVQTKKNEVTAAALASRGYTGERVKAAKAKVEARIQAAIEAVKAIDPEAPPAPPPPPDPTIPPA